MGRAVEVVEIVKGAVAGTVIRTCSMIGTGAVIRAVIGGGSVIWAATTALLAIGAVGTIGCST